MKYFFLSFFTCGVYAKVVKYLVPMKVRIYSMNLLTNCIRLSVNICISIPYIIIHLYIKRDVIYDASVLDVGSTVFNFQ